MTGKPALHHYTRDQSLWLDPHWVSSSHLTQTKFDYHKSFISAWANAELLITINSDYFPVLILFSLAWSTLSPELWMAWYSQWSNKVPCASDQLMLLGLKKWPPTIYDALSCGTKSCMVQRFGQVHSSCRRILNRRKIQVPRIKPSNNKNADGTRNLCIVFFLHFRWTLNEKILHLIRHETSLQKLLMPLLWWSDNQMCEQLNLRTKIKTTKTTADSERPRRSTKQLCGPARACRHDVLIMVYFMIEFFANNVDE